MASTERVHCLLCSVDLPVTSMQWQLECRQDLVAVWQTVTNGSVLKPGETTVCHQCFAKLKKCLTAAKTICSVADTAQNAVGLAVSTTVTSLSLLRGIQDCVEQISHDNTTQTESAETAEKNQVENLENESACSNNQGMKTTLFLHGL